ncbi:hypothetical protein DFQ27_005004 [Actinomortierella ambigua]|uniref:Geranylgeranyl transferase type-2 subunit alpha n=1 Tax=Actinomortierella ambigua TaxID=1343610 RepID=A0A9P6U2G7_9FUNG|nr:hypothetical protein DFQ27_005004 [Actinomortierella ambigua]
MEGRHGQKKQVFTPEGLKAKSERDAEQVNEFLQLKAQLNKVQESKQHDNEALKVTTAILRRTPDYYSCWNIRRNILLEGFLKDVDKETADKIYMGELEFLQENLKLNPKSYYMWNHRRWCLEHMNNPPWHKELAMVGKFLELDARNFHGWDYRRYIIRQLDQQDKGNEDKILERARGEFEFTTTKISQNFSNYSAWHNRSKLLTQLVASMTEDEKEAVVENEFDQIKNAIYTDPEDQSAWLYELWLVGREDKHISILGASVISFQPLLEIVVAFDETIQLRQPFTVMTRVSDDAEPTPLAGEWKATGSDAGLGSVWIFQQSPESVYGTTVEVVVFPDDVCGQRAGSRLMAPVCFELETINQDLETISGRLTRLPIGRNLMYDVSKRIGPVPPPDGRLDHPAVTSPVASGDDQQQQQQHQQQQQSPSQQQPQKQYLVTSLTRSSSAQDRIDLLEREISAVRELMEIEPDSKWPLQVLSMLLSEQRRTMSLFSKRAKEMDDECIELQEKLIQIDPLRQERYEDRRTQLVFDRETLPLLRDSRTRFPELEFRTGDEEDEEVGSGSGRGGEKREIDQDKEKKKERVAPPPRHLDLSMRGLTHIPMSSYFIHLETLNLDSNAITTTRFLRNLLSVKHLVLSNNSIKRLEGLQHAPSLAFLTLENNLIGRWEDFVSGFVFWGEGKLSRTGATVQVKMGGNPLMENEGGEYVLEKRWDDVGVVGVHVQFKTDEQIAMEETLAHDQARSGTISTVVTEGCRRVSTTVVEFDAGPATGSN